MEEEKCCPLCGGEDMTEEEWRDAMLALGLIEKGEGDLYRITPKLRDLMDDGD